MGGDGDNLEVSGKVVSSVLFFSHKFMIDTIDTLISLYASLNINTKFTVLTSQPTITIY